MPYLINFCLLLLLLTVVLQDFKHRLISWPLIPLLFMCFFAHGLINTSMPELLRFALFNSTFIILQLLLLTLYVSIKQKKVINIINSSLGLGDVLFLAVITIAFSPINFILFYLIALVFTLISYRIYIAIHSSASKEIPLAGIMSVAMMILILADCWSPGKHFYDDTLLTHWLIN